MIKRYNGNPVVTKDQVKPSRPGFEVIGTFNAGVTKYMGDTLLLIRVAEKPVGSSESAVPYAVYDKEKNDIVVREFSKDTEGIDISDPRIITTTDQKYLTSISHFRLARSSDGFNFTIDDKPILSPGNDYEAFGIEDPRITMLDDKYYIVYSSASTYGIVTSLASTSDFHQFHREGVIFSPDNKDVVLFPDKINGKYYALHRPSGSLYGRPDIWIAESSNLIEWGNHRRIAAVRLGMWDCERIGAGAVPFLTDRGWVEIYHGADENSRYCLGVLLLDKDEPWKVLGRSLSPLIAPESSYEKQGFFNNVIFTCGAVVDNQSIYVYYGAADESIACFTMELADVFANLEAGCV
ncbi:MAG TPA: glycosidase [Clostridiales bacterium]|nr:glycosidase [Clostridiales bacterium]